MIDLICVEENNVKNLSCGIVNEERFDDRLLGPVPYDNGVTALAEMLYEALPGRFANLKEAQTLLTYVHMRNVSRRENAAGTSYPFRAKG